MLAPSIQANPVPSEFIPLDSRRFSSRATLPLKSDSLWQIKTGTVRTLVCLEDGTVITTGIWGSGDLVGQLIPTSNYLTIECLTDVEAVALPLTPYDPLYTQALVAHLQQAEDLMVIRSHKKIDVMLLRLLSWLAKRFGRIVEHGQLIDLRLTHQDLSELLGSTRVTVTRTLSQLEQQKLIQRIALRRIVLSEEEVWHYEI
ncbi:Crp/Fnr family transcriptional regulator [Pantanalinema sp. GBBB05]|uniref:Crp/Fnr family transcriptional regulator n=1 Tax=Pantanalinema sp. GBBB05 TaxID=2604139 RepID=UPI001D8598F7|nr:Crp/Fnr family transcriptional regulator [Pantanalinema sp. GBBB05]